MPIVTTFVDVICGKHEMGLIRTLGPFQTGDPFLFGPFWKQNAEESTVVIPGWYRIGYQLLESSGYRSLTPALEKEIRTLHSLVGNAVTENKYIVVGVGSMQLLNAAVAALAPNNGTPASVISAVPYYSAYRSQTERFATSHYAWAGDAYIYAEQQSTVNGSSIEFVNTPNNPDGAIRDAVVNGSNAFVIYDLAYYWPHFTAITAARDDDVMLFTLSKVTGHAGSRLGWAIVKDYSVYSRLLKHVASLVIITSHETQLRATQLLRTINKAYSKQLIAKEKVPLGLPPTYYASKGLSFHYAYATLRHRWKRLNQTLETSQWLGLQLLDPSYCNFFKEVTGPSPAYAWVHCKEDSDEDCETLLFQAGIIARAGL
ncbi:hypothetical protein GOP47_0019699 [Adiantum capillus-veneris]|uniref:Alliinase C-terminal domain-containing protein n=1 Tax=Adiantum capillus-veneris TaxID=13818 RepID=A0A9D4Z813_ADICA|nr:hypothetical protein GOP47_0019699 [Adiantum capillus-veneris]